MTGRKVAIYYAWSRPGEVGAPLPIIENRFPALFESRRMLFPRFEELADPARFDQSIAGFLDHLLKANFIAFTEQARAQTGHPVNEVERVNDGGVQTSLDDAFLDGIDTLIVISFDSLRTGQQASAAEEQASFRHFLDDPDHLVFVSPHHDIGDAGDLPGAERLRLQEEDFLHHGDRTIPPQQRFGGFARSLLAGLGVPVERSFWPAPRRSAEWDRRRRLRSRALKDRLQSPGRRIDLKSSSAFAALRAPWRRRRQVGRARPSIHRSLRAASCICPKWKLQVRRIAPIAP